MYAGAPKPWRDHLRLLQQTAGKCKRQTPRLPFNELARPGRDGPPLLIGRLHRNTGPVAPPTGGTEARLEGSDAVPDGPLLTPLINPAGGASWVSLHHGGGVGM